MGGMKCPIDHANAWKSILDELREAQGQCALMLCDFDHMLEDLRDVPKSDASPAASSEPVPARGSGHDRSPLERLRTLEAGA